MLGRRARGPHVQSPMIADGHGRTRKPMGRTRQGPPPGGRGRGRRPQPGRPGPRGVAGRTHARSDARQPIAPESTLRLLEPWGDRAPAIAEQLARYVGLLLEANRAMNLTADRTPERQWSRHIEDALLAATRIESIAGRPGRLTRLIDVGAGGGSPGLIWAILWPEARPTLLEATGKKVWFLKEALRRLGLDRADALQGRAEELAHEPQARETFDWASARALAPLPTLAEWTLPLVKPGGWVFAIKGPEVEAEIQAARRAFRLLGAPDPPQRSAYQRPDGRTCHLLAYRKRERTPSPYPRRAEVIARLPL